MSSPRPRHQLGTTRYEFQPVGWDLIDPRWKQHNLKPGDIVAKTTIPGCPAPGTMGHTYVSDPESGEFRGLVLVKSLKPVRRTR